MNHLKGVLPFEMSFDLCSHWGFRSTPAQKWSHVIHGILCRGYSTIFFSLKSARWVFWSIAVRWSHTYTCFLSHNSFWWQEWSEAMLSGAITGKGPTHNSTYTAPSGEVLYLSSKAKKCPPLCVRWRHFCISEGLRKNSQVKSTRRH